MRNSAKRFLSALTATLLAASLMTAVPASGEQSDSGLAVCENGLFRMSIDTSSAALTVEELGGQITYTAIPTGEITGLNRARALSPLLLSVLNDKGEIEQISGYSECVSKKTFEVSTRENGILVRYCFENKEIEIPVLYELRSDGFAVHILTGEIVDQNEMLLDVSILPYFGAASSEDRGYFIVPDGCGALIDFNNGRSAFAGGEVRWSVYGSDAMQQKNYYDPTVQSVKLPMFGMHFDADDAQPAHGILAWIESGAALGTLVTACSTADCPYNNAYFAFNYRPYTLATLLDRTSKAQKFYMASDRHTDLEQITVSYRLLGAESSYSDMAALVSEELFGSRAAIEKGEYPVFLDVYMSVYKQVYTFGIPHKSSYVLTSLEDCREILEEFSGQQAVLLLRGLDKYGAAGGTVTTDFSICSKIGSLKEYLSFVNDCAENGNTVYPECEFVRFTQGTLRYNGIFHAASSVTGKPLVGYFYNPATLLDSGTVVYKYLTAPKILDAVEQYCQRAVKKKIGSAAPLTLGNSPYTDHKKADRENMTGIASEALQLLRDSNQSLLLENPDGYALPFCDRIIGLPVASSGNNLFSRDVPFLQMVLGKFAVYSGDAINMAGDTTKKLLACAETGSALTFTVTCGDYDEVRGTALDFLYSADQAFSGEWIRETARQYNERMAPVADSYLVAHEQLADRVTVSIFENGGRVIVNRSSDDYLYGDVLVEAGNYAVLTGEEEGDSI